MNGIDYSGVRDEGHWLGRAGWVLAVIGLLIPVVTTIVALVWIVVEARPLLDTG
jgi:hypothetical protein